MMHLKAPSAYDRLSISYCVYCERFSYAFSDKTEKNEMGDSRVIQQQKLQKWK